MAQLRQVVNGVKKYIDSEILPKIPGWNKWVVGASASLMLDNSSNVFNLIKENSIVKAMNVIDKDNEIDIDKLYDVFLEQAKKSAVTFNMPLIGNITLKSADVEKLYSFIKSE